GEKTGCSGGGRAKAAIICPRRVSNRRSSRRGSARPTKGVLLGSLIREMLVRSSPRKRGTQVFGPLDSRFRGNERNSIQRRKPHYAAPRRTRSNHSSSESTATPRS